MFWNDIFSLAKILSHVLSFLVRIISLTFWCVSQIDLVRITRCMIKSDRYLVNQ